MLLPGGGQQCQGMGGQWDLDSLLQELVLALVGYTGDIFVDSSTDNPRCPARCCVPTHTTLYSVCVQQLCPVRSNTCRSVFLRLPAFVLQQRRD